MKDNLAIPGIVATFSLVNTDASRLFKTMVLFISLVTVSLSRYDLQQILVTSETPVSSFAAPFNKRPELLAVHLIPNNVVQPLFY